MQKQGELITFADTDFSHPEILKRPDYMRRRSPVIVTIADPKITPVDIGKLLEIGMNIVRFKTSHCTRGDKMRLIGKVDKAAAFLSQKYAMLDWPVATCVELKTCIVNTGLLEGEEEFILLKEGAHVVLSYHLDEFDKCNKRRIFVDNPFIAIEAKVGMLISIDHDEIVLRCKELVDDKSIKCVVTKGGKLTNMCTVSIRGGAKKERPVITKKDLQIVKFALEHQVDMIIINYTRQVETIRKVKQYGGNKIKRPIIICGICTAQGLKNIDDIINESDGILLSREFLAYELEEYVRYRMIQIQKWVGAKCKQAGKPLYISGGIFKQMLLTGNCCDCEISDVTNALLDGATGFILKECPDVELVLETIKTMNEVCCSVEPLTNSKNDFWRISDEIKMPVNAAEACAISCAALANQSNAKVIVIPTVSGRTARTLMWLRPTCIVLTVSTKTGATRLLQTCRCVVPLMFKERSHHKNWESAVNSRVLFAIEYAVKRGWLQYGDTYVTLQRGSEDSSFCDVVRMWTVAISKKTRVECADDEGEPDDDGEPDD